MLYQTWHIKPFSKSQKPCQLLLWVNHSSVLTPNLYIKLKIQILQLTTLRNLILSENPKEELMLQKVLIPEFFSITKQYFLNCSLTTCKPELTITDNCLVEHCLAPAINLYLYGFLWSWWIQKSRGIQRFTSLHLIPKLLTKTSWCSEIISWSYLWQGACVLFPILVKVTISMPNSLNKTST